MWEWKIVCSTYIEFSVINSYFGIDIVFTVIMWLFALINIFLPWKVSSDVYTASSTSKETCAISTKFTQTKSRAKASFLIFCRLLIIIRFISDKISTFHVAEFIRKSYSVTNGRTEMVARNRTLSPIKSFICTFITALVISEYSFEYRN